MKSTASPGGREQRIARARALRAEGLTYQEIGECVGVGAAAVWKWLNPESARVMNQRANERTGSARWYNACPRCGARKNWDSPRCGSCRRADDKIEAERRVLELVELWQRGLSAREIGEALGVSAKTVGIRVSRLRSRGWALPIRNQGAHDFALAHPERIEAARALRRKVAA